MAATLVDQVIGKHWHSRFLERYEELYALFARCIENKRNKAAHPAIILDFFMKYQEIMTKYQLPKELIFNIDEKGFLKRIVRASKIIISET